VTERCVLLLGGSFDPVHQGHVALARYFCALLHPDELRLIPAGRPWQKPELTKSSEHRIAMLRAAFSDWVVPVVIDTQEIEREGPTYAIDTLRALRNELGNEVALVMLLGADQLLNLHTWRDWQKLFDLASLCIATRPGFDIPAEALDPAVADALMRRRASSAQLRATPHGLIYLANELAMAVSSTEVRQALAKNKPQVLEELLPPPVLDYIQHHHLYQTHH
jgi:nicotinate-nucleotide adenylyltransferase